MVECADGRMCPEDFACDAAHQGCVLPQQLDSCEGKSQGAECSYRGVRRGACYEQVCLPAGCGNGILDRDTGEVCDDGNRFHGDGCSADCRSDEVCGNAKLDVSIGEACDTGAEPSAWCRADCSTVRCGDGLVDREVFEQCDEGAANSAAPDAACRPNCQPRRCGDGIRDRGEVCDDGNLLSGDGCSAACKSDETCGNGIVDIAAGESCEPDASNVGWCRADCVTVRCGDGIVDRDVFEGCDRGVHNSAAPDAECRPNCQPRRCGDGIEDSAEACDDGNQLDADGCSHDCRSRERCGNGYVDLRVGEQCDDANLLSHDGCSSRCQSEAPAWRQLLTVTRPELPYGGTWLPYDAMRDTALLLNPERRPSNMELHGSSWQARSSAHMTSAFYSYSMAWDAARRRVVQFGGSDGNGLALNETWEWDGRDWLRRHPASRSPGSRHSNPIVYDPIRRRTVVFGGVAHERGGPDPSAWYADTWEWDGEDWREVLATGGPPMGKYGATFDPIAGRVVAFDGQHLWSWEGTAWQSVPAPLPVAQPILQQTLVFEASSGRLLDLVVFGDGRSPFEVALFAWDGSAWQSRPLPDAELATPVLIYRAARRRLSLFTPTHAYEWDGSSWLEVATNQRPSERSGNRMVYDPLHGTALLFGGSQWVDLVHQWYPETWIWDGSTWSQRAPGTTPSVRVGHAMVYDPRAQHVLMFGGYGSEDTPLGDTWSWDGDDWQPLSPVSSPPARSGHSLAYDRAHGHVVLFGGNSGNDLWRWDGHTWAELEVEQRPLPRTGQGLSYDPIRGQVLLFGGTSNDDLALYNDVPTLAWDGVRWQKLDIPGLSWRADMGALYEPHRRATLLISGVITDNVHTWSLPAVPASSPARPWEALPIPFTQDPRVSGSNAVYDSVRGAVLAFTWPGNETWELSYRAETGLDEVCQYGFDVDGDGLAGCADPDCWGHCTPLCPPGLACDGELPHCGDGTCNSALETCRMCPQDCGACAPLCGDLFCDPGESIAGCPGDCTHPVSASP